MHTKAVNIRHSHYDIYIGRPSKWGNPFRIGVHGNREQVLEKYQAWLLRQPELLQHLEELRGKRLGCFCKPQDCHGDVLVALLEETEAD